MAHVNSLSTPSARDCFCLPFVRNVSAIFMIFSANGRGESLGIPRSSTVVDYGRIVARLQVEQNCSSC